MIAELLTATRGEIESNAGIESPPGGPFRARLFHSQIPPFVIASSILADALACSGLGTLWWTGLILLMAAVGLLWASRFVRESTLVYIGLWHAVAAGLDLSRWLAPWDGTAMLLGWLAITLALAALLLWLAGVVGRRCRLGVIYWAPCLNTALGLTIGVFALAITARVMTRDAFGLAAVALVLDSAVFLLCGNSRRWAGMIYPAVASFTAATYVVLLSVGPQDPAMAYVLGLNAVVQGLLVWVLGDLCRRFRVEWPGSCARPLFHSALILTVLAIPPAYRSPVSMALVALSFLLTVKSLPSAKWMYPAGAAIGAVVYFPWLSHVSRIELLAVSIAGAYLLWLIGLWIRRNKARSPFGSAWRPWITNDLR